MRYFVCRLAALIVVGLSTVALGDGTPPPIEAWLGHPILDRDVPRREVRRFAKARIARMPRFDSLAAWRHYAEALRQDVLDHVVYRGEAARWRVDKTRVEWLDTIPSGEGYHIRKLRFEALPKLWIPALLYEPDAMEGPVPVVLNVNGHDPVGKAAPYKQIRCINQAKRGMLALNVEWFGMGQLRTDNFSHYRANQLGLCGTSAVSPFYLAMRRALDVLLDQPHADPRRVAVAGLSGGGWQTIFISALDPRVTLCNPVAGYSSMLTRCEFDSDLGDTEQTPTDLGALADYTHLTAMLAPRPAMLTFNAIDSCCFRADHALGPLLDAALPAYELYGRRLNLRWHVNYHPGNHNFELDNRQAFYAMLSDHFSPPGGKFQAAEIPSDAEIKSADELNVPLPDWNADFHRVAMLLSDRLPRRSTRPSGQDETERRRWVEEQRRALSSVVRFAPASTVTAIEKGRPSHGDLQATFWQLKIGDDWTVPAVELAPKSAQGTAIVLSDEGRAQATELLSRLLSEGHRVLAVDLSFFGEANARHRPGLLALLISSVGERPLGVEASQLSAVARWVKESHAGEAVSIATVGRRAGTVALVAAALDTNIQSVDWYHPLGSLRQVIEENLTLEDGPELFCFGLLGRFDIKDIAGLIAPRSLSLHDASQRAISELSAVVPVTVVSPQPPAAATSVKEASRGKSVRIAGLVLKWILADKEANFRRIVPLIRKAAAGGAKIVSTTECFLDGYAIKDKSIPLETYRQLGEPVPGGKYVRRLAALADELDIYLIAGMTEAAAEQRYNTALLIGPDGRLMGKYHKQKLGHELVRNTPGNESPVFQTPYGRMGLIICADRTRPSIVRRFCEKGADFLICPSGGMFGAKTNDPMVQARARENHKPIIFVHPAEFLVVGPDGSMVARSIIGDRLLIRPEEEGRPADESRVFFFDLPLSKAKTSPGVSPR